MWRGRLGDAEQGRRAWDFLSALAAERGRRDKQDQSDPMCTTPRLIQCCMMCTLHHPPYFCGVVYCGRCPRPLYMCWLLHPTHSFPFIQIISFIKTVFARDHLCDTRRSVLTACQENESHHKITAFRIARCWLGAGSPKFVWFQPRRSEERSAWRERTRDERGNERQDALCAQVEQFTPTRES